jgi:Sulfotransferase family
MSRRETEIDLQNAMQPGPWKPVHAEQLIWIFGGSRTGSTWLSQMMAELENQERWHEPYVGLLFGSFLEERLKGDDRLLNHRHFIMGAPYREAWLRSIRNFVLEGAAVRFPELREDQYLVVKEPNGSIGAPLMMEALPESRMILLVRDPRDAVASSMDRRRPGSWNYEQNKKRYLEGPRISSDKDPLAVVQRRAKSYLQKMGKAKEAYDAHQGRKVLIKYEELRADTLGTMKRLYSTLELGVDEAQLKRAVEKHSWENIPEEKKGEGKRFRKATPGGWKEDLAPEQARMVEEITAPLLEAFYPHEIQSEGRH